ncbi:MAG: hypothetical protein ACO3GX_03300 [Gemmataceae bacterium]
MFHRLWIIATCLLLSLLAGADPAKKEPFRPTAGKFPPIDEAKSYRGELVFVDHVNRRGSLRLHVDGHFGESKPHHFAMLPYGIIRYRGAPADLRDIPLGTVLYGKFYLPQDPKTSSVPDRGKGSVTQPAETYAILLEDDPSFCLREGKSWKLMEVEIKNHEGTLLASMERKKDGEGLGGDHKMTLDSSTRIWRGRELLGIDDLVAQGVWNGNGKKSLNGQPVQLSLTWHPRYLYQQFHVSDIWLDDVAMQNAAKAQTGLNHRFIKTRWMPAWVDSVDYGKFGRATITATLFGGMDPKLYADFKKGTGGQMAAAEATLRTYWPDHDGMEGMITDVIKSTSEPPLGSSGIQVRFETDLVLEGFRPGRIVRVRPQNWPKVKPPSEECIHSYDERWPTPAIFGK